MTTTTANYAPVDLALWLYPGEALPTADLPHIQVSGPVDGVWTITAPDSVSKQQLDNAIVLQASSNISSQNQADLMAKAAAALNVNSTFLAIATPTNAQVVAQTRALTRQVNALIRLRIGDFSSTVGT